MNIGQHIFSVIVILTFAAVLVRLLMPESTFPPEYHRRLLLVADACEDQYGPLFTMKVTACFHPQRIRCVDEAVATLCSEDYVRLDPYRDE